MKSYLEAAPFAIIPQVPSLQGFEIEPVHGRMDDGSGPVDPAVARPLVFVDGGGKARVGFEIDIAKETDKFWV